MSWIPEPSLATLADVFRGIVFASFVLCSLLMTLVILVQEGKGGGIGAAFGGAAADAFGVKAGTVNRFTAWLAAAFLGLALLYAGLNSAGSRTSFGKPAAPGGSSTPAVPSAPATTTPEKPPAGEHATPPGGAGTTPPAGEPSTPAPGETPPKQPGATPPGSTPPESPGSAPESPGSPESPAGGSGTPEQPPGGGAGG